VTAVSPAAPGTAPRAAPGAVQRAVPGTVLNMPGQRGRTTLADSVVTKVAAQAVSEVERTGGVARELMGIALGRQTGGGSARVWVRIDGHLAMIEVRLSVAYPAPVRSLTREVRQHVIERVGYLTGLEVRHVDIEVARLLRGR
jgi:uncharacterized alkaline shock family protein YloU